MKIVPANLLEYPKHFPPSDWHVEPKQVEAAVSQAFSCLLNKPDCTETEADTFLKSNPALLGQCLNFTNFGHHGTWVIPQKLVDPGANTIKKGKKPDYILGGKNSDGFHWCVVELKGPADKLFKRTNGGEIGFSSTANEGICQLIQYIDYCSANQSFMRDHFKLNEFREPRGFLVIGREAELEDEQLQQLRSAWNRISGGRLMIRSYDALLRSNASSWSAVEHSWSNDG